MADRIAANQSIHQRPIHVLPAKPTPNLMQNCDLPPPAKLFSGPNEICRTKEKEDIQNLHIYKDFSEIDKLEILEALRLSQTRAREAERKVRVLFKEKDEISKILVDESLRVFAHRQWAHLLEFQVLELQNEKRESQRAVSVCGEAGGGGKWFGGKWFVAVALGLAVAGMGFAFGWRYFF